MSWQGERRTPAMHRSLVGVAYACGAAAGVAGAAFLAGWLFIGPAVLRAWMGAIYTKTNAALGLLLAGAALVLLIPEDVGRIRRWAGRACATVVLLFGALTFSEHLIGWNLGIDQLLATEPPGAAGVTSPDRMGPTASLSLMLLGTALLLLSLQGRRAVRVIFLQALALVVVLVALLPTIGYLYGADELYGVARYTGIAWPTAVALLALGLGVLCARPQDGLMALVTADDPGGMTVRRLLLPTVLLPLVLGWLRLEGERRGFFEAALGTAMMMLIFIVIFSTLSYYAGRRVTQASAATEQKKQLLAVTLASIGDGVIVTDPQGRVTFLNGEAERLTGWTNCDAEGRPLPEVFHIINEQTRQAVESPVDKVRRLGTVVGLANHTILVARDGRETPIDDSGAPVRQADGTVHGVVLVFRDFSERRRAEEALRSVAQFPDQNPQPVVRIDREGTVLYANCSSVALSGEFRCQIGQRVCESFARLVREALDSGQVTPMDVESGGRVFSLLFAPIPDSGYVNLYGRDVTDRKLREDRIAKLTRLYAVLSQVNEAIVRARDAASLFAEVCRIVTEQGGFPLAWIGQASGNRVVPLAWSGSGADYVKEIRVEVQGALGRGPTGTCIRENRLVVNDDFATSPAIAPWRDSALRYGFRASAAFPLRHGGETFGALTLYAVEPNAFDAEHTGLLEALSADVSYALDAIDHEQVRARAEEALRESEEQFRTLADSIPNLAWWADGNGYITWYNRRWYEYTGTTPSLFYTSRD
ncbi:MAG: GAF domain-containing protein [Pirellulales bacterium]